VASPTVLERRFFGKKLVLDVSRASPQKLLWLQGERFVRERSILQRSIRPGMTVVDVGANIGYYALMCSALVRESGRVVCIEPDPANLNELRTNVVENGLQGMVTILAEAAGDQDGTARFEPGLNSHVVAHGSHHVTVRQIDSLALGKVDFMKIDVEGYEGAVLDGAAETIERFRPTLFVELHPHLLTQHTHCAIVELLQRRYRRVSAYQIERTSIVGRLLEAYGIIEPFSIVEDLPRMVREYEAGSFIEPCWLLAENG
jgi:FkbM family methyltransferase